MIYIGMNGTLIMDAHLDGSESTAYFGAAVPLCNFQVSPPPPEDLEFTLQLLQVVSVPGGQGASILTLTQRQTKNRYFGKHVFSFHTHIAGGFMWCWSKTNNKE